MFTTRVQLQQHEYDTGHTWPVAALGFILTPLLIYTILDDPLEEGNFVDGAKNAFRGVSRAISIYIREDPILNPNLRGTADAPSYLVSLGTLLAATAFVLVCIRAAIDPHL